MGSRSRRRFIRRQQQKTERRERPGWLARLAGLFWRPAPPPAPPADDPKPDRSGPKHVRLGPRARALAPLRAHIGGIFREHRTMVERGGDLAGTTDETLRKLEELRAGLAPEHRPAGEMVIDQAVIYVQLGMTYGNEFCDAASPLPSGSS